jgi:hypothetical protein
MKKTKIISLVLLSAAFTSCKYYYYSASNPNYGPAQPNDTVRVSPPAQPYNNNYDYYNGLYWNWNLYPFYSGWNSYGGTLCYDRHGRPYHYGPRRTVGGNTARLAARTHARASAAVSRGGFGASAARSAGA